jgi:hypothetical protein
MVANNAHRSTRAAGVFQRLFVCIAVACISLSWPLKSQAWKPHDHIYAANRAISMILSGVDAVEIDGRVYAVDPNVARAIRNHPGAYRAGVIGPDGFPDIYVGQKAVHPDRRCDNGTKTGDGCDNGFGHAYTHEWLRHVYEAGWVYYSANIATNPAEAEKALAFAYGFLTHAAGDIWAHTLVNDISRGIFPPIKDVTNLNIGVRHLVSEVYIGTKTPLTPLDIDPPLDFIYMALIGDARNGGFVDSSNRDSLALGNGVIFKFFLGLRNALEDRREAIDGLGPLNPLYYPFQAVKVYLNGWVEDLDAGLHEWPSVSNDIAHAILATQQPDYDVALARVEQFIPKVLNMLGAPDVVVTLLDFIKDILEFFSPAFEPLADGARYLVNYLLQQLTDLTLDDVKQLVLNPDVYIGDTRIGFDANTAGMIDQIMGIPAGTEGPYNPDTFVAMKNTITSSKLVLLSAGELNRMLYDHRVGPIYADEYPLSDRANFLLGYVRTIDGHSQWRKTTFKDYVNSPAGTSYSEGMPIWNDCIARSRVFRALFTDWQNSEFPDLGEAAEDISATPPPSATMTINGRSVAVGGKLYVGAVTKFIVASAPDHFWNAGEITVTASLAPGGPSLTGGGPLTLGPIAGADGVYTVAYNAAGACVGGPPHGETPKTREVTLDKTAPVVQVTSPTQGQDLDVVATATAAFSAADTGVGLDTVSSTLDGALIANGATIDAFNMAAGEHKLAVTATDLLGNTGTVNRLFYVRATVPGLKAAIGRARAERLITLPTRDSSAILSQLDGAQQALAEGRIDLAKKRLATASNMVTSQSGKGVDPGFATRFAGWAGDLIARL